MEYRLDLNPSPGENQAGILNAALDKAFEPDSLTELIHWTAQEIREMERLERALIRARKLALTPDITWRVASTIRTLHLDCRAVVHRAFPCEQCGRPIAQLKPLHGRRRLIVDAELTSIPGICEADLLSRHVCGVQQ
jgi:hypothetical protein